MIWKSDSCPTTTSVREQIADYLMERIRWANTGLPPLEEPAIREIAQGVAIYLDEGHPDGFRMELGHMLTMAAQVLSALGHPSLSRRLPLFGTGLICLSDSPMTGNGIMLVLDLQKLTSRRADCLEMVLLPSLLRCVEIIADTWDNSSGDGMLGLRHMASYAKSLLPHRVRAARLNALKAELMDQTRTALERIGTERGWRVAPHVINLDTEAIVR